MYILGRDTAIEMRKNFFVNSTSRFTGVNISQKTQNCSVAEKNET